MRTARAALTLVLALSAAVASGQTRRNLVVDQTGLPLPGVTIQLLDGERVVASETSGGDGTFAFDAELPGHAFMLSLDGFESRRVARAGSERIEMSIARATESTTVVGSALETGSPTAALLGSQLTATAIARLPSSRMKARESLPLLPSILRGADGLMQLGGARAYDTPLTLDGFNVTDPATGVSSVNLPFETVAGIEALRDPMAITYGGMLGGLVRVESKVGSDRFKTGVQGFVPRPRFTSPGFGRIEGIFPRAYAMGNAAQDRIRYVVAAEYDYERIAVPEVTERSGQNLVEESAVLFTRVDATLSSRMSLTLEGFTFPARTRSLGLGPRRDHSATVDVDSRDLFAGATHRVVTGTAGVFTIQLGVVARDVNLVPNGNGDAYLSPDGWRGNWFTRVHRTAARYTATAAWQRNLSLANRSHDVTIAGGFATRRLDGIVHESPIHVTDESGRDVRTVTFGAPATLAARDRPLDLAVRDVWQAAERVQIEMGGRLDQSRHGGVVPSGRVGLRLAMDPDGVTVIKAGYGRFVGNLPLMVPAFASYPSRTDRWVDPDNGSILDERSLRPQVGRLHLPRANALVLGVERHLAERLDGQVTYTSRRSTRLATLHVPSESGALSVESDGAGWYREIQLSLRRTWADDQQVFVSYVRASSQGEVNDFGGIFQSLDHPLVQPGGRARTNSDVPHRVLAWGTFNLPQRVVVSPVGEWRSGFPYSPVNVRQLYQGSPNARTFPRFIAIDAVTYKTFTVKRHDADVGVQLFNLTGRRNPRDVYPVTETARYGTFANSVGVTVRGYMLLKW